MLLQKVRIDECITALKINKGDEQRAFHFLNAKHRVFVDNDDEIEAHRGTSLRRQGRRKTIAELRERRDRRERTYTPESSSLGSGKRERESLARNVQTLLPPDC